MDTNQFISVTSTIDKLMKENRINEAIVIAENELQKTKENPILYSLLGELYEKVDIDKSIEYFKKGLERFPDNLYLLIGLGFVYYNKDYFIEALNYFKQAWFNDPLNIKLITAIGNALRNLKDFQKAEKFYRLAIALEQKNVFALFGLADCYRGMNQHANALEIWIKLAEIEPENKIFLTRIGDAYRMLKEHENALIYYNKALDLNYDFYAELGKALTYEQMGQIEESQVIFESIENREGNNSRYFYEYIKFLLRNNLKDKAKEVYQASLKRFPDNRYILSLSL